MMSDLTEKCPFFSTVPQTGQCHFKSREAGLCSHLSQHTCAHNCSQPRPSQCTPFPVCMAVSQCAACTTGAQKDSFIFHIFMPCHSNHGRQELRRNGKRQYVQLLPDFFSGWWQIKKKKNLKSMIHFLLFTVRSHSITALTVHWSKDSSDTGKVSLTSASKVCLTLASRSFFSKCDGRKCTHKCRIQLCS